MQSDSLAADIVCPQCGYDLRAIQSPRCPECGCEIDREALRQSVIPWTHRRRIGNIRAFVKTAWMTVRHPSEIANEPANSVNLPAARQFRTAAVTCAWIALGSWMIVFQTVAKPSIFLAVTRFTAQGQTRMSQQQFPGLEILFCWFRYVSSSWYLTPALVFLMLAAASGVATCFSHPRGLETARQERAFALSYYGCGPMTFMVIPAIFCGLAAFRALRFPVEAPTTQFPIFDLYYLADLFLPSLAGISLISLIVVALHAAIRINTKTTDCPPIRRALMAITLPIIWLTIGAIFLLLIPAALGLIQLMVESYSA